MTQKYRNTISASCRTWCSQDAVPMRLNQTADRLWISQRLTQKLN